MQYSNLFPGTFEMPYFKNYTLSYQLSSANWAIFESVNLYNNVSEPGTNFENLFCNYDLTSGVFSEPPSNSLFNIQNMQQLVSLGESTANIMVNTTETFNSSFTLSSEWTTLTQNLGLTDTKQTYLLWLWLWNAQKTSFQLNTGKNGIGYIGQIGSAAFEDMVSVMQLEVPLFTIAS